MDPAQRCRRNIRADEAETRVWNAVMQILDHPELVAAEVAKQQVAIHEQEAAIDQELAAVEAGLARCNEQDQRLVNAYVAGALTAAEFKAYRADIVTRRQSLETDRQELLAKREALQHAIDRTEVLVEYCTRVRQRLHTFSLAEMQMAFDALTLKVFWTPDEPLRIDASIPLDAIVSSPSCYAHFPGPGSPPPVPPT